MNDIKSFKMSHDSFKMSHDSLHSAAVLLRRSSFIGRYQCFEECDASVFD